MLPTRPVFLSVEWQFKGLSIMKTVRIMNRVGRHTQSGFLLLEALLALAIFASVSVAFVGLQIAQAESEIDAGVGGQLKIVQSGVNDFVTSSRLNFINNAAPTVVGFANPLAPTMVELTTTVGGFSFIPNGYAAPNALGMTFTIAITRIPVGCTPGTDCTDVAALITSSAPAGPMLNLSDGTADIGRASHVAQVVGADAAFARKDTPTVLEGIAGVWPIANPLGAVPGVIVMRAGFGSVGYASLDYLMPRDGSKPFTGDISHGGNSITNVRDLTATGDLKASTFVPTALVNVGQPCSVVPAKANAISVGTDGTNNYVVICRGGSWSISGPPLANPNDPCPTNGVYASSVSNGVLLICTGNRYLPTTSLISKNVETGSQSVIDGSVVTKPICDTGGTASYKLIPNQSIVGLAASPPVVGNILTATSISGTQWQVSYKVQDSANNVSSGTAYGLQATIFPGCSYP